MHKLDSDDLSQWNDGSGNRSPSRVGSLVAQTALQEPSQDSALGIVKDLLFKT